MPEATANSARVSNTTWEEVVCYGGCGVDLAEELGTGRTSGRGTVTGRPGTMASPPSVQQHVPASCLDLRVQVARRDSERCCAGHNA